MDQPVLDLWPQTLEFTAGEPPVEVLRQQAALLGQRTGGEVLASVQLGSYPSEQIDYAFYLKAPALGEYRYRLFSLRHGVPYYPVEVHAPGVRDVPVQAGSREQFLQVLRALLSSE